MSSLLRSVKKRKKSRVLGEVQVVSREECSGLELDSKVEMIRALIPLGLMHVEELLDGEVKALAGERYARKAESLRGRRHGSNPGTVGLGGQSSQDSVLELLDEDLSLIEENDDFAIDSADSRIVRELGPGGYFLRVTEFEDAAGPFQVNVRVPSSGNSLPLEEMALQIGDSVSSDFRVDGTRFPLQLDQAGIVRIEVHSEQDSILELLDEDFNLIVRNDDVDESTLDSAVVWELEAGNYYARILELDNRFGPFEVRVGSGELTDPVAPDDIENLILDIGGSVVWDFQPGGTGFPLNVDTAIELQITVESDLDSVLELLNEDFRLLTTNDDADETTLNSRLTIRLRAGTYFVRIRELIDSAGTFEVRVSETNP